jgi:hypothetical protein
MRDPDSDQIARLNASMLTRAQVLRATDSDEVFQLEYNRAFVAMQYVGYLRRTPESAGYNAWLTYLNAHPQDFREMVRGFVDSVEYRARFGRPSRTYPWRNRGGNLFCIAKLAIFRRKTQKNSGA